MEAAELPSLKSLQEQIIELDRILTRVRFEWWREARGGKE
jgi:hypothetical protein